MKNLVNCFLFALVCFATLSSCATFQVPKDYVPDSKVVYLMQNTGFNPIRYDAVAADPYVFAEDASPIDALHPHFLKEATFDALLKPDYIADGILYREVSAHFQYMLTMPLFFELRAILDSADIKPPVPLSLETGAKVQDYTNGAEYEYPPVSGAKISILNSGIDIIRFADGSSYQWQKNGLYFWNDAGGKTVQQYDPERGLIVVKTDSGTLTSSPDYRGLKNDSGELVFSEKGDPQYILTPAGTDSPEYTYFTDAAREIISCSVKTARGIRFDYFTDNHSILAISGLQAISISSDHKKVQAVFDPAKREATDLISLYLPQGIRLMNLNSFAAQSSVLNPQWPESYKMRQIGSFDVWYTEKDAPLLAKISGDRLTGIESKDKTLTGLDGARRRAIVIPPDLDSYRKLYATRPKEIMNWYPSGFETLDYITLWPISVPRYDSAEGQAYFFNQELYEIVTHEYVHLLVGENAGLLNRAPVWLNEGLAVYVECCAYPDAKAYWDTTLAVAIGQKRLLPWDEITVKSTGEYPIAQARTHYAQSYGLVSLLVQKYGSAKVAAYVKSFMVKPSDQDKVDLVAKYKENYRAIFGVDWDGAKDLVLPKK
jgi:hypothetical protein